MQKWVTLFWLVISSILFLLLMTVLAHAKELPEIVPLCDLKLHDGKRIAVDGWIRSEAYFNGRMGSNNLQHKFGIGECEIIMYTSFPTYALNHKVIVIGTYKKQGRFAGKLVSNFIVAEVVVKDWRKN